MLRYRTARIVVAYTLQMFAKTTPEVLSSFTDVTIVPCKGIRIPESGKFLLVEKHPHFTLLPLDVGSTAKSQTTHLGMLRYRTARIVVAYTLQMFAKTTPEVLSSFTDVTIVPCKGIRIPESGKFLLVESRILAFGIRNTV